MKLPGGMAMERGMLPLLDISLMLLGLMIVVTVARSEAEEGRKSVWAGSGVVLLELGHEEGAWRAWAVDPDSGRRVGSGRDLADAGGLVHETLAREDRSGRGDVVVVLRCDALLDAPEWRVDHSAALRDSLAAWRWHIVWGGR